MNKQRKVVITTTYNEMGIIIDTKVEEVAQPNLQPTCNQLATDTISRRQAIDECNKRGAEHIGYAIAHLPSAQPEPKIGKWIAQKGGGYCCSECGRYALDEVDGNFIHVAFKSNFCPYCGAHMKGVTTT